MKNWLNRMLYGLLPGKCILCSAATNRYLDLCLNCETDLPRSPNPCWQCGLTTAEGQEICGSCLIHPPPFSHCFAALEYSPPVDRLIHQFKNQQKIMFGKVLATVLSEQYLRHHMVFPDAWIPVPLHKDRLKHRGFNQALEIAEVLADTTQVPVNPRACRRITDTGDQKSLSAKQRKQNMKNVFTVDFPLNGETIGIIDDVVTTTATVSELTRLLLKHGASDVQIICLARTPVTSRSGST